MLLSFFTVPNYDVIIRKVRGTANVKWTSYLHECALLLHNHNWGNMK